MCFYSETKILNNGIICGVEAFFLDSAGFLINLNFTSNACILGFLWIPSLSLDGQISSVKKQVYNSGVLLVSWSLFE